VSARKHERSAFNQAVDDFGALNKVRGTTLSATTTEQINKLIFAWNVLIVDTDNNFSVAAVE